MGADRRQLIACAAFSLRFTCEIVVFSCAQTFKRSSESLCLQRSSILMRKEDSLLLCASIPFRCWCLQAYASRFVTCSQGVQRLEEIEILCLNLRQGQSYDNKAFGPPLERVQNLLCRVNSENSAGANTCVLLRSDKVTRGCCSFPAEESPINHYLKSAGEMRGSSGR